MPVNSKTDDRRRDTYYVGDVAGMPGDGHLWVDSSNSDRIKVFRNGSWVTPRFNTITLTGTTTVTTLNSTDETVASLLTAQTAKLTVASVTDLSVASSFNGVGLVLTTPAALAGGKVVLGTAAVPTTGTSTSGFIQISALPGTPVGQTANPATNTVFLTYDTIHRSIAIKAGGSWFTVASMELY